MLNKFSKSIIASAILFAGLGVATVTSYGKTEYTKKEKKSCTYCHTAQGKKDLNDIGKCYAAHDHSLEACATAK